MENLLFLTGTTLVVIVKKKEHRAFFNGGSSWRGDAKLCCLCQLLFILLEEFQIPVTVTEKMMSLLEKLVSLEQGGLIKRQVSNCTVAFD